jgi:hypothetical protein
MGFPFLGIVSGCAVHLPVDQLPMTQIFMSLPPQVAQTIRHSEPAAMANKDA